MHLHQVFGILLGSIHSLDSLCSQRDIRPFSPIVYLRLGPGESNGCQEDQGPVYSEEPNCMLAFAGPFGKEWM